MTIEIWAAVFGALSVLCYIRRNHWSWPLGLVQVVLYVSVFARAKLYADTLLHIAYAVLQLYGWWSWYRSLAADYPCNADIGHSPSSSTQQQILIRRLKPLQHLFCLAAVVTMTLCFTYLLDTFTDASMPLPDSFVAATSLVAQLLLAWRFIENWPYWIAVDVVAIGLFTYKALYPTSILYAAFLVMAAIGWYKWNLAYGKQLTATKVTRVDQNVLDI
jgi:nicotinamide mononucleotide transporter